MLTVWRHPHRLSICLSRLLRSWLSSGLQRACHTSTSLPLCHPPRQWWLQLQQTLHPIRRRSLLLMPRRPQRQQQLLQQAGWMPAHMRCRQQQKRRWRRKQQAWMERASPGSPCWGRRLHQARLTSIKAAWRPRQRRGAPLPRPLRPQAQLLRLCRPPKSRKNCWGLPPRMRTQPKRRRLPRWSQAMPGLRLRASVRRRLPRRATAPAAARPSSHMCQLTSPCWSLRTREGPRRVQQTGLLWALEAARNPILVARSLGQPAGTQGWLLADTHRPQLHPLLLVLRPALVGVHPLSAGHHGAAAQRAAAARAAAGSESAAGLGMGASAAAAPSPLAEPPARTTMAAAASATTARPRRPAPS